MDMGPRRPTASNQPPAAESPQRSRPVPARPPAATPSRTASQGRPPVPARPVSPTGRNQSLIHQQSAEESPVRTESRGGWRTILQVIIGIVVIAAVASAIVVLYIRYYQ
jgi:hypothetical protein